MNRLYKFWMFVRNRCPICKEKITYHDTFPIGTGVSMCGCNKKSMEIN